jgi:ABC-type Fe3+-siderophore transport system permease subunit
MYIQSWTYTRDCLCCALYGFFLSDIPGMGTSVHYLPWSCGSTSAIEWEQVFPIVASGKFKYLIYLYMYYFGATILLNV